MADNRRLEPILLDAGQSVFAALDGAQFDDLPSALFDNDFVSRALYLDRGNGPPDRLKTAPQLVWLDRDINSPFAEDTAFDAPIDGRILNSLMELVGQRPAVVFWHCEAGGEKLYKHLRTINKVLFPKSGNIDRGKSYEQAPTTIMPDCEDDADASEFGWVVFRHADPNVMAQVLPCLGPANYARLIGVANRIFAVPDLDWSENRICAVRDERFPTPYPGPLRLQVEEVGAMEILRTKSAWKRRILYLRETCPFETAGASEELLTRHLKLCADSGRRLGLQSEGAHCRWAFLVCKTGGRILYSREAFDFICCRGSSADMQVRQLMADIITWMRSTRETAAPR
jgi:hypothetical protein